MAVDPARRPARESHAALRLVAMQPGLTADEARAVDAGRREAFRPGWDAAPGRWWQRIIGRRRVTPFADERLELLRLFAGAMRRDDRRADSIAARLQALGVSDRAMHQAIAQALA